MLTTDDSVFIICPVHEVFAFVSDVTNDPKWNPDTRTAVRATAGPIAEGTVFHVGFKPFLGASSCDMRVAGITENQRLELAGNPGPLRARARFFFEPEGTGTKLTRRTQIRVTGPLRLLEPLMRSRLRKQSAQMLTNLKTCLERGTSASH